MYTFAPLLVKLCWKSSDSSATSVHLCRAPRVIDLCENECEVWVPKDVYLEEMERNLEVPASTREEALFH